MTFPVTASLLLDTANFRPMEKLLFSRFYDGPIRAVLIVDREYGSNKLPEELKLALCLRFGCNAERRSFNLLWIYDLLWTNKTLGI